MAMGKRRKRQRACGCRRLRWPRNPGHPFYERLSRLLDEEGFDAFVRAVLHSEDGPALVGRACTSGCS